jgi:hypothetical protein
MASQLRLQVVLPVAVLAILGLGVGAFALGKSPSSGGSGPPPAGPPQSVTTTTQEPTAPGNAWAARTNAWCRRVNDELALIDEPKSRTELLAFVSKVVRIEDSLPAKFRSFGWSPGKRSAVLRLRADLSRSAAASHAALAALRSGNLTELNDSLDRWRASERNWNRGLKQLGARACASESIGAATSESIDKYGSAYAALSAALLRHGVVVVLFYAPGDDYDAIQTRETRAGALSADAGFLALNVKKNSQVAALAAEYDIRDAPATVIFKRGPTVVYRVAGYMDRDAIAQAAANAAA